MIRDLAPGNGSVPDRHQTRTASLLSERPPGISTHAEDRAGMTEDIKYTHVLTDSEGSFWPHASADSIGQCLGSDLLHML